MSQAETQQEKICDRLPVRQGEVCSKQALLSTPRSQLQLAPGVEGWVPCLIPGCCPMQDNPFADMGKLMENVKKAQELVKTEGARVQEELSK